MSTRPIRIAPSILSADFTRLGEQLREAEDAGADWIHVDVMDGHFVPNITLGPAVVEACRRATRLPLDLHLMIDAPERFVADFASAGADRITVHAEVSPHLHRTLQLLRSLEVGVGLALNPLTPLAVLEGALPLLDLVLVMTVNPGFGGQSYIDNSERRVAEARAWADELNPDCVIEVDGGIAPDTAPRVSRAGAEVLVAGSAIFRGENDIGANIAALRRAAEAGRTGAPPA